MNILRKPTDLVKKRSLAVFAMAGLLGLGVGANLAIGNHGTLDQTGQSERPAGTSLANRVETAQGAVLGAFTDPGSLIFRIQTTFTETLNAEDLNATTISVDTISVNDALLVEGGLTLHSNVVGDGVDIDVGSGQILASNIVYSIQGQVGEVSLIGGSGIALDGLTISNSDPGSAQKIFKNLEIGDSTITAGSNTDTLKFTAGSGVSLSVSDKTVTFAADNLSGWHQPSATVVSLISGSHNVGIGTSAPTNKLELDSGSADLSGLTFTRLTSGSSSGVGGGKVLSLDSGGRVILVNDQTGGTAEDILPTSDTGGTLFFNGTTWVSSTNLYHNDGSVGISTTSPQGRLHLRTNAIGTIGAIVQGETSQTANLQEWRNGAGSVLSYIDAAGVFNGSANVAGSLNPGLTEGQVTFQGASGLAGSNNLFWNNSSGNLGIGTTVPTQRLDVYDGNVVMTDVGIAHGMVDHLPTAAIAQFKPVHATFGGVNFSGVSTANLPGMEIEGIIGVDDPTDTTPALWLSGSKKSGVNRTSLGAAETVLQVATGVRGVGTTLMTVLGNGNVGIGTTVPTSKLQVSGNINAGSFVPAGYGGIVQFGTSANGTNEPLLSATFDGNSYHGLWIGRYGSTSALEMRTGQAGGLVLSTRYAGTTTSPLITFRNVDNTTDVMSILANGNVGIGTTSPGYRLHVVGSATNTPGLLVTGGSSIDPSATSGQIMIGSNDGAAANAYVSMGRNSYDLTIDNGINNDDADILFRTKTNATAINAITIKGTGNVGIGTTAPLGLLNVSGAASGKALTTLNQTGNQAIFTASTSGATKFLIANDGNVGIGTTSPLLSLDINGATYARSGIKTTQIDSSWIGAGTDISLSSGASGNLIFKNGSTEAMRAISTGNVGIGTTAPASKLEISSTNGTSSLSITNQSDTEYDPTIKFNTGATPGTRWTMGVDDNNWDSFAIEWGSTLGGSTPPLFINSSNNVAIGQNSASSRLNVKGHTSDSSGSALNITNSSNTSLLYVRNDGNVGIGTTSPAYKLDVISSVADSPLLRAVRSGTSRGLTLDSNGNATFTSVSSTIDGIFNFSLETALARETSTGNTATGVKFSIPITLTAGTDANNSLSMSGIVNQSGGTGITRGLYLNQTITAASDYRALEVASGKAIFGGNVGIGTTSPTEILHVAKESAGDGASAMFEGDVKIKYYQKFVSSSSSYHYLDLLSTGDDYIFQHHDATDRDFIFKNQNTEQLRILNSGNVGIGTTAPLAKLSVNGDLIANTATISATYAGGVGLAIRGTSGATGNLQEWQNSSGSPVTVVDKSGFLDFTNSANPTTWNTVLKFNNLTTGGSEVVGGFGNGFIKYSVDGRSFLNLITDSSANSLLSGGISGENVRRFAVTGSGKWQLGSGSGDYDSTLERLSGGGWQMASTGSNQVLSVSAAVASDYAAEFLNDGNNANRYGLQVQAGLDDQSAAGPSTLVQFNDGDGTAVGSISFGSNLTAYNTTSDQRAKENIVTTSMGLDQLMQIPIRDFNFRADTGQIAHTGFIAQELFPIFPDAVTAYADERFWQVDYGKLTPLIIKSVQDQQQQILQLKQESIALSVDENSSSVLGAATSQAEERLTSLEVLVQQLAQTLSSLQLSVNKLERAIAQLDQVFQLNADVLTIVKNVVFKGRQVYEDVDKGGFVVLPAGQTSAQVSFQVEFSQRPIVTLTPESQVDGYYLEQVSERGFTIRLKSALDHDATFNWVSVQVKDAVTTRQQPSASPVTSEAATPGSAEVSPTSESVQPDGTPSVSPQSSPSLEPQPALTQDIVPTPIPSPESSPSVNE